MPLVIGQHLFECRIERALGWGASGVVYLAQDTNLSRPVAIKELTLSGQADEEARKRFHQEARAAGGLSHPHIVTVYALRVEGPCIYLVMEYVAGGSLRALLDQCGRLPVEEAVRIAAEVCEGLAAAHERGIVHRDVKPENILLTEDGRAKIGDFGVAHVPRSAGGYGMTSTGFQPGTLLYMSPEQIRGQDVDGRSDVYQVGTLLYEMLTGRCCVDFQTLQVRARESAGTTGVLLQARLYELLTEVICYRDPEGVCNVRPDLPLEAGELVKRALAKNRDDRPTAAEFARALRRAGNQQATRRAELSTPNVALAKHHLERAMAYKDQDRLDDAIREIHSALRNHPEFAEAHCSLGAAYLEQGRLGEAVDAFQATLRIDPRRPEPHIWLGIIYNRQARFADAIKELQTALHIRPDSPDAHFNLGGVYYQQGRLEEAIHEYKAELHINPNDAGAHLTLGTVYYQQGRLHEAANEYGIVLRINPNDADAHFNLAKVYVQQDRMYDALSELHIAAQLGSDAARVDEEALRRALRLSSHI